MAAEPPRKEGEGPPLLGGKADGGLRSYGASNQVKEPRRPPRAGKTGPFAEECPQRADDRRTVIVAARRSAPTRTWRNTHLANLHLNRTMPRREVGTDTPLQASGRAFCSSDTSPLLAPTAFNAGKRTERGDASFVNNTIKGSLTCQNNVPAPVSGANTAENIQGQRAV
jgi:hypothetical protein